MSAQTLKKHADAGIRLSLDSQGALVVESLQPLTPDQRAYLKAHRAEIITALEAQTEALQDDRIRCIDCRYFTPGRECLKQANGRGGYWRLDDFYARTLWRCPYLGGVEIKIFQPG
jgi:hypothetical protein